MNPSISAIIITTNPGALSAVASDGAKAAKGVVDDRILKRVRTAVTGGALVAFLALLVNIAP